MNLHLGARTPRLAILFLVIALSSSCLRGRTTLETNMGPGDGDNNCAGPCDPLASTCDNGIAKQYEAAFDDDCVCVQNELARDCIVAGLVCASATCVDGDDPCATVTCDDPPANACDGDTRVIYPDVGRCRRGECVYDPGRTNCMNDGNVCANAECIPPDDPCATVPCDMPPANRCEATTAVTYDAVGTCDNTTGMCTYTETMTPCMLGTTCTDGVCVPDNPMTTTVTIPQIQDPGAMNRPAEMSLVRVEGAVLSALAADSTQAWMQDTAGGQYSGIHLVIDPVAVTVPAGLTAGSSLIDVEGTYAELDGISTITVSSITDAGTAGAALQPATVSVDVFTNTAMAEAWEGVLVQVEDVIVTGATSVDAKVSWDTQLFAPTLSTCDDVASLAGVVHGAGAMLRILPRDMNDVGATTTNTPLDPATIVLGAGSITPATACVMGGAAVTWSNMTGAAVQVVSLDPMTGMPATMPDLDVTIDDMMDGTASPGAGRYPYIADPAGAMTPGELIVLE